MENTYRTIFFSCFAAFLMLWNTNYASSDQDMISLAVQSLGIGSGNTAPASAYNPNTNEYLVIYARNDGICSNEKLFGIAIDAITGEKGTEFAISECDIYLYIKEPKVVYNSDRNEYGVFYKSSNGAGAANLIFRTLDATTYAVGDKNEFGATALKDPYENNSITYVAGYYVLSYHEKFGSADIRLNLKFYKRSTNAFENDLIIDKGDFNMENEGINKTAIVASSNNTVFASFELLHTTGSEIYGGFIDVVNGLPIDIEDFFPVSPIAGSGTVYLNPTVIKNPDTNELLVVYEESHLQVPTAALNKKIKGQLINATDGTKNNPMNASLTNLPPDSDFDEDVKLPTLTYSSLSQEYIIHFYGRRWINETENRYHNFYQRINSIDLSQINQESSIISQAIGSIIINNNSLIPLGISYNSKNNSYLLSWLNESSAEVVSQIWRYDNNPPKNLDLSQRSRNENLAIGTTFGTFSAQDPDPEDSNITYALAIGIGDTDNNYFTVSGNKLVVNTSPNYEEKATLSIRVKATDTNGASTTRVFTLTINDIPEKPENITLSEPLEITENTFGFTSIITAIDEDIDDEHSFKLVAGDSSDNNANFSIDGNTLILENSINYEDSSYQYIRIEASDASSNTYSKAFAINVTDINEPADTIYISPGSIPENNPDAFVSVMIEDPDKISNYTISLTAGEGGEDNKYFTPEDNRLLTNTAFDFEEKSELNIRILIKEGEYTDTAKVVVKVEDVNDAPESISLSNNIITEGMDSGYKIGKVSTYDQDVDDTHEYVVLEGDDLFFIDEEDSLITKIPLVYNFQDESKNLYKITVQSTDNRGASKQENFTIKLIPVPDNEEPSFGPYLNNDPFQPELGEMVLSVAATDNEELDTAYFYHRKIRSSEDFVKVSTKLDKDGSKSFTIEATVDETYMDELGMEYYFEIFDAAGNAIPTPVKYVYLKPESVLFEPTAKSYNGSAESYRIISNPYELGSNKVSAIFSDYGPSSKENWRLFKYDNGQNIEIGADGSALLEPGKAYWFNKSANLKNPITLEKPEPLEYNRTKTKIIQLRQGWNLIGNPYPFSIDWENILAYNNNENIHPVAYKYEKGHKILSTLEKFEGVFVYADNTTTIEMPVLSHQAGGRIAKYNESSFDWLLKLNLSNEKINYDLSAIGMHEEASESFDRFDTPLLPRFINYADLAFEHPEHHSSAFTKDISDIQESHIWEFIASTNSSEKQFQLNWNYPEFSSTDKQLMLYDITNNIIVDMSLNNSYSVNLDEPVAFKAIYGDRTFVHGILSNIEVQALNPYPNPFKTKVNLPVVLPQSNLDYEVSCSIFNLMGEKIYQQVDTDIPHGIYDIIWSDEKSFNKGIYIYSIKVKNKFLSREFHGRLVKD